MEQDTVFCAGRVRAIVGNIIREQADAIVNAANSGLLGGGGVDGAIHKAGGPAILEACRNLRETDYPEGLPTGEAVATTAGDLSARYVIHTVGPVWRGGAENEDQLLAAAYRNSLELADSLSCQSIVFPAISTGVFGFPPERAAGIVLAVLEDFFSKTPKHLGDVRLIFFKAADLDVFLAGIGQQ
jgi:O-acetyl-ADP-ribose deacetylase (regulator of RNase III)